MILVVVVALLGVSAVYYHRTITPPGCADPRTLALVHDSLITTFKLPDSTRLTDIRTVAGGYLAFRFVCEAEPTGFDRRALPPGSTIPGTVHYISRLTDGGKRHVVTVRVTPLLIMKQVQ